MQDEAAGSSPSRRNNVVAARNQAKTSLAQAQMAAADARPVFERNQIMLSKGLISPEAFGTAKVTCDQSQSAAEVARALLLPWWRTGRTAPECP